MPGGFDQIEGIYLTVPRGIIELNGPRLDRDAAFALDIHIVQQLVGTYRAARPRCQFQNTVRQRA